MPNQARYALLVFGLALWLGCDSATEERAPVIAADQVVDRATLKTFVEEARRVYLEMLEDNTADQVNIVFRDEGGPWKHDDIHVFILTMDGVILLNGGNPALEGEDLYDFEDLNGVKYVQELIATANQGGGYVQYYFDNPAIEGDEEVGSLKVSYVIHIAAPNLNGGETAIIGSGIYP